MPVSQTHVSKLQVFGNYARSVVWSLIFSAQKNFGLYKGDAGLPFNKPIWVKYALKDWRCTSSYFTGHQSFWTLRWWFPIRELTFGDVSMRTCRSNLYWYFWVLTGYVGFLTTFKVSYYSGSLSCALSKLMSCAYERVLNDLQGVPGLSPWFADRRGSAHVLSGQFFFGEQDFYSLSLQKAQAFPSYRGWS